jgi:membrane-associated phospholipid phosphatase
MKIKKVLAAIASLPVAVAFSAKAESNLTQVGNALMYVIPVTAAGISYAKDDTDGVWQLMKSEALTIGVTGALKYSINAERPNGKDQHSFPSAHTSISFSAAQYLQSRYGWEYGLPAYLASGLVGYSRVDAKEHYWRDVAVGAAIGMASSWYLTDPYKPGAAKVSVIATPQKIAISFNKTW